MTKYDILLKKHIAAKTVTEQKALVKEYLLSLSPDELIQWYMETPDIIEKNINELIALEGEKGRQEARAYLASAIETLEKERKPLKVAA